MYSRPRLAPASIAMIISPAGLVADANQAGRLAADSGLCRPLGPACHLDQATSGPARHNPDLGLSPHIGLGGWVRRLSNVATFVRRPCSRGLLVLEQVPHPGQHGRVRDLGNARMNGALAQLIRTRAVLLAVRTSAQALARP